MSEHLEFNSDSETFLQKRLFRLRLYIALIFVLLLFSFLISRMVQLQWIDYERYQGLAEGNRISVETLAPTRGKIYDRNHQLLADNQPVYTLKFIREKMDNIESMQWATMQILNDVSAEKIQKFFTQFKQKKPL